MKRNSPSGAVPLVLLAVVGGVAVASFLGHQDNTRRTLPPSSRGGGPTSPVMPPETKTGNTPPPVESVPPGGVIYTVSNKGGDDNDLAPRPAHLLRSQNPARDALKELIRANGSPIPSGTTLRGIKIADGLATVDFSEEFQTNFHGSDTEEAQTVNSVLKTLGQFPQIQRVQILVEGKSIDALSQLSINEPLPVIRPETSVAARPASDVGGG